jgi:pyruvate dehydrogenase E2 component (dihydrolipoamide acetyltransferase)
MADVSMPRLSDTMEEGTIASWLKKPGEQVNRGDVIAQIETDKATMDLTAFETGTLEEILAPEGTTVAIGQPVARIASAVAGPGTGAARTTPDTSREQARHGAASAEDALAVESSESREVGDARAGGGNGRANGKVRASPMARHLAAEHGLDLTQITGSGPQGRVIRADVEAALAQPEARRQAEGAGAAASQGAAAERALAPLGDDDERLTLSQMRRTIARRLTESTRAIPHFFLTSVVDATELVSLRQLINAQAADVGIKVTFNDLVVKAAALALRKVPDVNVSFAEDSLIRHAHVHVGIAVATDRGLLVPVIRDADQKSLGRIAAEARDLAERANSGKLQPAEYSGGTFTVSNLGMFGVEQFSAVINPPEAAILAVGAILREPAEHQGEVALRDRLRLTLSVDHRALDGAAGARYLQALQALLEKPVLVLI